MFWSHIEKLFLNKYFLLAVVFFGVPFFGVLYQNFWVFFPELRLKSLWALGILLFAFLPIGLLSVYTISRKDGMAIIEGKAFKRIKQANVRKLLQVKENVHSYGKGLLGMIAYTIEYSLRTAVWLVVIGISSVLEVISQFFWFVCNGIKAILLEVFGDLVRPLLLFCAAVASAIMRLTIVICEFVMAVAGAVGGALLAVGKLTKKHWFKILLSAYATDLLAPIDVVGTLHVMCRQYAQENFVVFATATVATVCVFVADYRMQQQQQSVQPPEQEQQQEQQQ